MDNVSAPAAPAATGTPCAAWCTSHYDGSCRREATSPTFGRLSLEHDLDGRPMVFAYGLNADELTMTQAAQLARTLDTLVAAALIGAVA